MKGSLFISPSVAPRVGAWIETQENQLQHFQGEVAPRVGAWIETNSLEFEGFRKHVAPYLVAMLLLLSLLLTFSPFASSLMLIMPAPSFEKFLGIETVSRADGHARLTLSHQPQLTNPYGIMHGGAIVSLADSALAAAIYSLYPRRTFYTVKLNVDFRSPVRGGKLLAEARVREQRRKIIFCDATIVDEGGTLVAEAKGKFYLENETASSGSGDAVSS